MSRSGSLKEKSQSKTTAHSCDDDPRPFVNRRINGIFRSFTKGFSKKNNFESRNQGFTKDTQGSQNEGLIVKNDISAEQKTPSVFNIQNQNGLDLKMQAFEKIQKTPDSVEAVFGSKLSENFDKPTSSQEAPPESRLNLEKEPNLMTDKEDDKTMQRRFTRAKNLRRTTFVHYDQQGETFRRRKAPQLFEIAVLIALECNSGSNEKLFPKDKYLYVPKISFVYPSKIEDNLQPLLNILPPLCYADLSRARPENPERYKDEQFLMIVTDTMGDRKYAYCHRFAPFDLSKYSETDATSKLGTCVQNHQSNDNSDKVLPQILCIVTPINASSFYFDLVHEAALRSKSGNMKMLVTFLTQSFRHRLPPANGIVTVKLVDDDKDDESSEGADTGWEVVLVNRTTPKKGQGLGELVHRLGVDNLVKLFCALLCEKRVLLIANSVPILSRSIQAASNMLAPFEWPHTLIPVVPDPFLHLCFSPVPYLIGVLRDHLSNLHSLIQDSRHLESHEEYMFILDLDKALVLKDNEWTTTGSTSGFLDYSFGGSSSKLLPNRITRSLKQVLKDALKSTSSVIREQQATDAFQWTFIDLIGHYRDHVQKIEDGDRRKFNLETFVNAPTSRSQRNFLKWFVETGMFQVWINSKLDNAINDDIKSPLKDAFDRKLDQLKAAGTDSKGWSWGGL